MNHQHTSTLPRLLWLRLLILSLAAAGYASYHAYENPTDNTSVLWWLAGILLMIAAGAFYDYQKQPASAPTSPDEHSQFLTRWDWLLFVLIILLAFALRVYRLDENLPPMHGDEGEKGILALTALNGPNPMVDPQPVPVFSTRFFGHPTLYHYMQAMAMWLLGQTLQATRIMNAFFGALAAGALYFYARVAWGRWAALFAGWLMAVSHTYIQYSRTNMSMIPTVFAIILMFALFGLAFEEARARRNRRLEQQQVNEPQTTAASQSDTSTLAEQEGTPWKLMNEARQEANAPSRKPWWQRHTSPQADLALTAEDESAPSRWRRSAKRSNDPYGLVRERPKRASTAPSKASTPSSEASSFAPPQDPAPASSKKVVESAATHHSSLITHHSPLTLLRYVAIGLVIGWSQYMYFGSRLLPVLGCVVLLYLMVRRLISVAQIVALVLGFAVIYAPLGWYFYHNPQIWIGRLSSGEGSANGFSQAAIQRGLGPDAVWPNDLPRYIWLQVQKNARYFIDRGDVSTFYWPDLPGFDPATAILLWLGVLVALLRMFRYHEFITLAWFGLGVFLAGVMTIDSPYGPRLIIAMPSVFLLAGLTVQFVYNQVRRLPIDLRFEWLVVALLLMGYTLFTNYNYYFIRYAKEGPIFPPELAARAILAQPEPVQAFFLTGPSFYQNHGAIRFLARDTERFDLQSVDQLDSVRSEHPSDQDLLFFVTLDHLDQLEGLKVRFPQGVQQEITDQRGVKQMISLWVDVP